MSAIHAEGLRKSYGLQIAVDGVSLSVERGEVFGPATGGSARVLGFDVKKDGMKIRRRIGLVQQQPSGEYQLRVDEQMELYGLVWDVPKTERKKRVEALLNTFDLQSHRRQRWAELSIGTRRRLQVAREFMHDMDLLFLDEPTLGLDPIARRATLNMIKKRVKEGLTVFFTTHILDEVEYLCNRVAIINNGKIVAVETPKDLKEKFGGLQTVEAIVEGDNLEPLLRDLRSVDGVSEVRVDEGQTIKIDTSDSSEIFKTIMGLAEKNGLRIVQLNLREPTLEQAFVRIVEKNR